MTDAVDPSSVRVVIADDQPAMRRAFRTILEAIGLQVVGEAGDGSEAVAVAMCESPDVVVMDIRMPGRDGLSATAELARSMPSARVLVLTTFDDDASLFGALQAGATGFLLKNAPPEDFQSAVIRTANGDAVLDPTVLGRVMRRAGRSGDATARVPMAAADVDRLTEREKDVLWLMAQGLTNAETAGRLGLSETTAKTHVSNVIAKLGVRDRVQAAIKAHEAGFADTTRSLATHRAIRNPDERPVPTATNLPGTPAEVSDDWCKGGTVV